MMNRLRLLAEKYGFGEDAVQELGDLLASALPRTPTFRVGDAAPSAERASAEPGDPARRYEDRQGIAVGGFSEVREVWDHHVCRRVARKVQLPSRSSPEDSARFRQEVEITARLQHPGVVPLHDWGELPDGRVWFTMKRIEGDTIGKRIDALHRLQGADFVRALRRLLDDFRRLCEPVAYAHAQRVIHRDLSPQNLMTGELGEVHVMDWGLARDLARRDAEQASIDGSPESASDPFESGMRTRVAGTPYYMPPEQARGQISAMGPPSDVYALGAVLYEILSGSPPYASLGGEPDMPERVIERLLRGPPRPIEEVARREAPAELFALCRRAMERSPSDRHADAGELMEALRDWLDGADRQARARGIVERAQAEHRARIEQTRATASRLATQSRELLEKLRPFDRAQEKAEGWKLADDARALEQEAIRDEIQWIQKLRSALNESPMLEEAHVALAEHYSERLLRAEADHDEPAATSFAAFLEDHAGKLPVQRRARYEAVLRGDGKLSLVTVPPNTRVLIKPYEPVSRYLMANEDKARALSAPLRDLVLPRGSYLVVLKAPGHHETRYPVFIGRGEHWDGVPPGSAAPLPIRLLRDEDLGPGDIHVPAGWFIAGGDPRAGEAFPRRRVWAFGFVIRKHPTTNGEFVDFLNSLVAEGRGEEARKHCPRQAPGATMGAEAPLAYLVDESSGRYTLRSPETDRDLPVVFVDWHAATAYADHLARQTGLPWRLPSELEWEKAARGVDGRFMPWGDHVEPTWACVSGSHPARKQIRPVHDYPTDVSPYGVRGMAGNVRDWCVERWSLDGPPVRGQILQIEPAPPGDDAYRPMRGGAWISVGDLARLSVRYAERPTTRHGVLGFRLARTVAP